MLDASKTIEALIEDGKKFKFENAIEVDSTGRFARDFKPEWISWTTRVTRAMNLLFSPGSAPVSMLSRSRQLTMLGQGRERFLEVLNYYKTVLKTASEILKDDTFRELASESAVAPLSASNRVFIVHGHDDKAKSELEVILGEMGLEPVVLHRQADSGKTLIEKFEHYSDVGFAFILLTPDEIAFLATEETKSDDERKKEHRARPNVIFEFGFFVGRLGRERTCCIYKGPVTVPSDLSGLVYKQFENSIEEVGYAIRKELIAAGYSPN